MRCVAPASTRRHQNNTLRPPPIRAPKRLCALQNIVASTLAFPSAQCQTSGFQHALAYGGARSLRNFMRPHSEGCADASTRRHPQPTAAPEAQKASEGHRSAMAVQGRTELAERRPPARGGRAAMKARMLSRPGPAPFQCRTRALQKVLSIPSPPLKSSTGAAAPAGLFVRSHNFCSFFPIFSDYLDLYFVLFFVLPLGSLVHSMHMQRHRAGPCSPLPSSPPPLDNGAAPAGLALPSVSTLTHASARSVCTDCGRPVGAPGEETAALLIWPLMQVTW